MRTILSILIITAAYFAIHHKWLYSLIYFQYLASQNLAAITNAIIMATTAVLFSMLCVTLKRRFLVIFLLFTMPGMLTGIIHTRILGAVLNYDSYVLMTQEINKLNDFIIQYHRTLVLGTIIIAILLSSIYLTRKHLCEHTTMNNKHILLCLIPYFLVPFTAYGNSYLPRYAPSYEHSLWVLGINSALTTEVLYNDKVTLSPSMTSISNIVILVDESITYEAFQQFIHPTLHDTGALWNFGRSLSNSNCSAGSNSLIRWAANPKQVSLGKDPRGNPTIWNYAKSAGYKTVMVDGQSRPGARLGNFMSEHESRSIDKILQLEQGIDTDVHIANELNRMLKASNKNFIYVVLRGAHFPYNAYPPGYTSSIDTKDKYLASVTYSKKGFFQFLLDGLLLDQTLLIYTSDHGQHFATGYAAHCNPVNFHIDEYSVPLIAITNHPTLSREFRLAQKGRGSFIAHSQLPATLLISMGYERKEVEYNIYTSLFSVLNEHYLFQHAVYPGLNNRPPQFTRISSESIQ
jgi:hypothetical protein